MGGFDILRVRLPYRLAAQEDHDPVGIVFNVKTVGNPTRRRVYMIDEIPSNRGS